MADDLLKGIHIKPFRSDECQEDGIFLHGPEDLDIVVIETVDQDVQAGTEDAAEDHCHQSRPVRQANPFHAVLT